MGEVILLGVVVSGIAPALGAGWLLWKRTDPVRRDRDAAVVIAVVAAVTFVCVAGISFFLRHDEYHPPLPVRRILPMAILAGLCPSLIMASGFFFDVLVVRSRTTKGDRSGGAPRGHLRAVLGTSIASLVGAVAFASLGVSLATGCDIAGANEGCVQRRLKRTLEAQRRFHRTDLYEIGRHAYANPVDGRGFADLYVLRWTEGSKAKWLKLIDVT